jgi:hypothetical protein
MLKYLFGFTRKRRSKSRSRSRSSSNNDDRRYYEPIGVPDKDIGRDLREFRTKNSLVALAGLTDYSGTQYKLKQLTAVLKQRCSDLSLSIVHIGNIPPENYSKYHSYYDSHIHAAYKNSLMICLNDKDECISSIVLDIDYGSSEISINSATKTGKEGKKYNTLMIAVSIIISSLIKVNGNRFTKLVSCAVNPVSAYTMIKFNVNYTTVDHADNFVDSLIKATPTMANIMAVNKKYGVIIGIVDLTYENVIQAEGVFNELVKKLICV